MGTTSNYSWPYPESTGLVKDGWEDIKDLATAIDTTAAASFASGLVRINTTTLSAVSSQSLNDIFSASYDNYLIIFNATIATSDQAVFFKLRASGTDTSTGYYFAGNARSYTGSGATTGLGTIAGDNTTQFYATGLSTSGYRSCVIDLQSPFLTQNTTYNTLGFNNTDGFHVSGLLGNSNSYDGITIYPAANNFTGTISVYGYRKS